MPARILVQPLGRAARIGDALMTPLMYLAAGTRHEAPQETHFWNLQKLTDEQADGLDRDMTVPVPGLWPQPKRILWGILSHIPILGGWRNYVVLMPKRYVREWYLGWVARDGAQDISRIPLYGPVRSLHAPADAFFFGLDADGDQISIKQTGAGRIGEGGKHARTPLR